ncbi:restriction endonuclease subunit S, partial [Bacillus cereus]|nr:restriction endonuclease subunit S [Bacillus cereus]
NTLVPLPRKEEQAEIVRILENLFENDKNTKFYDGIIEKVKSIRESILSKAFRGELGTNDPNEENAIELLKEILQEQVK